MYERVRFVTALIMVPEGTAKDDPVMLTCPSATCIKVTYIKRRYRRVEEVS